MNCKQCDTDKQISEYYAQHRVCKSCVSINRKAKYKQDNSKELLRARKYREENIDKIKSNAKKDYHDNKEKHKEKNRLNYEKHKEARKESVKKWSLDNMEHLAKYRKMYRQANKDVLYTKAKEHRDKPDVIASTKLKRASAYNRKAKSGIDKKRREAMKSTSDGSVTKESLALMMDEQDGKCYMCKCKLSKLENKHIHLEHIVPLAKGGRHIISNVSWSCMSCNLIKGVSLA